MSDIKLKPCPSCNGQAEMGYGDACYYVYCTHCNTCGAGEVDCSPDAEEQAGKEWNALPRRLQWTTKTPTEEGWYWNRAAGKATIIVKLYYDNHGEYCYRVAGLPDECWLVEDLADEIGCEWAGPIPEPQEAK